MTAIFTALTFGGMFVLVLMAVGLTAGTGLGFITALACLATIAGWIGLGYLEKQRNGLRSPAEAARDHDRWGGRKA
jgi:hypothetical protein